MSKATNEKEAVDKVLCCPPGSEKALQISHEHRGKVISLDGLDVYTAGNGKNAIIVFYDVFGFNGGRTRLICDQIADAGYKVVLPDVFHGESWNPEVPPLPAVTNWVVKFNPKWIENDTNKVLKYLDANGVVSYGCLGFCWGALAVFYLCQNGKVKCGASMHPAVQLCQLFNETPHQLASLLKCPQLVYSAKDDQETYKNGGEIFNVLTSKFGADNDIREFPEMNHGWVLRGDLSNESVARDVNLAMEGCLRFFKKHF